MRVALKWMLVVMAVCAVGWAQLPTSTLNGTVTDPQGAVVSGAKVTLTQTGTGTTRVLTTGTDGNYTFANLTPGDYSMRIEAQGFATQETKDLHLDVGIARTFNVSLKVAQAGEVITVSSQEAGLELTQSQVQGLIGSNTVESIPLNGRNFLELAYLLPGNRPATNYDPTKTNTLEVSSAGAFGRGGNITVDGGDNNDEVVGGTLANFPQDGVQEFQIATNRFTAEVGRSGSSIINIITKSGTNVWHGSGFFFFRHKALQGRDALLRDQPKPPFDREQFGGSLGGPIKRDKAFWFVSVEDRNQDAAVPVGERDLANYATCSVTQSSECIIRTAAAAPLDDVLLNSRADFKLTDDDNLFIRYAFNRSLEVANGSLSLGVGSAANRQSSLNRFNSIVTDWTRQIGNNKINDLMFHVDLFINEIPSFDENTPLTDPAGIAAGHEIRFLSGGLQDGANFRIPQRTRMNRYQIKDNFSWTAGKHTIRFGGEWQNAGSDVVFDLFGSGSIFTVEDFGSQDRNNDGVINDLDIPVLLTVLGTAPNRPPTAPYYRNNYFGLYFQDDWKVASNLTLNLGLRWDFDDDVLGEGPLSQPCADPTVLTTTAGCVWLRSVLGPHNAPKFHNFGPRFGFAWDPFKKGTTVVRGGYGIYYDRVVIEVPILEVLVDGRVLQIGALGGSTCNGGGDCFQANALFDPGTPTLDNPFVGTPGSIPLGGFNFVDNNVRQPLVHQFSFGVQHQIGRNWVISADGVHNFGQRLLTGRFLRAGTSLIPSIPLIVDPSSGFPGPCPASGGVDPCAVTDPATGIQDRIQLIASAAKSWYSGLLASLQKRPTGSGAWKWGFNVNYTLSKSYNFANDDQIPFNAAEDAVNLNFGTNNPRIEKGYSPTDERHRFVFYGIFEMPWQISFSPILTISSSVPMDPFVPELNSRLPILQRNSLGRDIRTGAELKAAVARWNALTPCLDPTTTAPSARIFPCRAGGLLTVNIPDNEEFGDGFNSLDFRVTKTWTFAERHNFQFITEVFNVFNSTNIRGFNNRNFSGFNNAITSSGFNTPLQTAGRFFGSGGARALQFAVRYSF
ncbi:MAG TPA: TonB-dependent receptor [Terriglobales bacterium]|nr:TonB-dependent receptor [Terriglobales bacterium]